ncbi:MAG: alpha-amylase family glycosyl hydrolase [Propionibacteriaceae bacterium]|nr:alpha-amylase family glycosyl hydrolase [Propionibacteriaceae bacterium]
MCHRLGRLNGWLDHVVSLGANGLALGPIWASSTHGYDIVDHDAIDPRLGDDSDFDSLIDACHRRGLRVLLDGVFNHVSSSHADVQAARRDGIDSTAGRLFRHDAVQADGLSRVEGHDVLVEYDHTNPAVADRVVATMTHWLRRGADGWRLDAAYRVPRPFWAAVIARVTHEFPRALTVAEVLHGNYAQFAADTGVDSVTQYELWKAFWSSLKDANPHELAWTLKRHEAGLASSGFLPWTFVGNHDVTRIATQIGQHNAIVAASLLMTMPGMPCVYYGDEYGLTGLKEERLGGDDAIRPVLPDSPDSWTFGTLPNLGDPPIGPVAPAEMLRQHQLLLGLRRRHPWLQRAELTVIEQKQKRLTYRVSARSVSRETPDQLDVTIDTSTPQAHVTITGQTGELYRW